MPHKEDTLLGCDFGVTSGKAPCKDSDIKTVTGNFFTHVFQYIDTNEISYHS